MNPSTFHLFTFQPFNLSTLQRFTIHDSRFTIQRFNALTIQRFNASTIHPLTLPSGIPRYQVNVCDWYHMLEPCPTCGYALSTVDHHCRHCGTVSGAIPPRLFNARHMQQLITALVALSVLVYLMFFR